MHNSTRRVEGKKKKAELFFMVTCNELFPRKKRRQAPQSGEIGRSACYATPDLRLPTGGSYSYSYVVSGACPATTDCIVAMRQCENNIREMSAKLKDGMEKKGKKTAAAQVWLCLYHPRRLKKTAVTAHSLAVFSHAYQVYVLSYTPAAVLYVPCY